jgi:hypothetical protein
VNLRLSRFHRIGAAAHSVALSADGEHLLVGSEGGLRLMDRSGNVKYRLGQHGAAFNAVALSPRLDAGLAMERAGRLFRLNIEGEAGETRGATMRVAAVDIWEQRDDLYSLDYAPHAGASGLIALGHHALGLTALDGRGQLLWRLGPREGLGATRRTWHAAISPDGKTIYATALSARADLGGVSLRDDRNSPGPSSGAEIVAIDAALGRPLRSINVAGCVTLLASLPAPFGVAAAARESAGHLPQSQLLAFDATLATVAWSLVCPPEVLITALASAPAQAALIVGTNSGQLWRVGAFTGRILARYDLLFPSAVLSVAVAENGEIAAGLANGQVAFLERVEDEG